MEYALTQLLIARALLLNRCWEIFAVLTAGRPLAETLRSTRPAYCQLRILKCESRRGRPVGESRYDP